MTTLEHSDTNSTYFCSCITVSYQGGTVVGFLRLLNIYNEEPWIPEATFIRAVIRGGAAHGESPRNPSRRLAKWTRYY